MSSTHATDAEEEYLQALFWLQEAELPMTGANVARAMQLSPPTVHEMVGRLIDDGYIDREPDKSLNFTEEGRRHAEAIVTRHRLIERFLTDVLGIPWDEVHEEAERMEHAMSPKLEERMMAAIGDAKTCPHGHPIILEDRIRGSLLADCEIGASVRILRFENEAEELLHYLRDGRLRARHGGRGEGIRRGGGRDHLRRRRSHRLAQRRRDRLGGGRPGPTAPRRAARAASALTRQVRALTLPAGSPPAALRA